MFRKFFTLTIVLTAFVCSLSAQNTPERKNIPPVAETPTKVKTADAKNFGAQALPASFRGIALGMDIETVKENLKADPLFGYRGERDLSLLTVPNRSSIETIGTSFISRAWFQFYEEALYTISLKLNTEKVDYYSIYSRFVQKYGEPLDINPHRAIWENETVRITVERPLTVKYLDRAVFNSLLEKAQREKTKSELSREEFINAF